jgi:hypothetical protein
VFSGKIPVCRVQIPRYEASEAISLAFVTALQLLPPRQRAALILCDGLGYGTTGFPSPDLSGQSGLPAMPPR